MNDFDLSFQAHPAWALWFGEKTLRVAASEKGKSSNSFPKPEFH